MRPKFMFAVLITCLFTASLVMAQGGGSTTGNAAAVGPHTPEKGSSERKAIADALRAPVEKRLRQPIIFRISHLRVQDRWAFLMGIPRTASGDAVDYRGTAYREAVEAGAFDDLVIALLHNVDGKWRVVQYVIGATDVPYVDWSQKYGAPTAIFPH